MVATSWLSISFTSMVYVQANLKRIKIFPQLCTPSSVKFSNVVVQQLSSIIFFPVIIHQISTIRIYSNLESELLTASFYNKFFTRGFIKYAVNSQVGIAFYVYGSVHRNIFYETTNRGSYMQSNLFHCQVHSTCFGCFTHPSSGVQFLTVSTATGTNHTVRYKDNVIRWVDNIVDMSLVMA